MYHNTIKTCTLGYMRHAGRAHAPNSADDMRGMQLNTRASMIDDKGPPLSNSIVVRTREDGGARPDDQILRFDILFLPIGHLVTWCELRPGVWILLVGDYARERG